MDLATVILGGLIVAAMAFLGSSILGFLATGIFAFAFPKIDKRRFAKAVTAIPPVMMCVLVAIILIDKSDSALSETEITSIPTFVVGAALALLVAWPLSYFLVRKVWRLGVKAS
ncbi:hypothetical protein GRI43_03120 [Altererythrobacter luteolus]|uniref:Uncharacterized protein n=1 Tax=Pontixanthobacter luteolus TaxID=295089 RepID=A0A6I4V1Z1_9SPHN|nr:hypothetical protein [Pontixanthobacter luteolus]MXP46384.1 hypothetical protein [Pontixanthobacter luteolus]